MAPVLAQMGRDPIRPREDGKVGRPDRVGMDPAPRVADGSHMVDVDAEAEVGNGHTCYVGHGGQGRIAILGLGEPDRISPDLAFIGGRGYRRAFAFAPAGG
jgi:hypothetical protein